MQKRTLLVIAAVCASTAIGAGGASASALRPRPRYETGPQFLSSSVPQSSATATLYRTNCQMCHGPDGKALIADMAFVGRKKWKHGTSSADMVKVITDGVKGTPMMPFKAKLTAAQIKALAQYVRAFDKRLPPEK